MRRRKLNVFVIACIIAVIFISAEFISLSETGWEAKHVAHADNQYLECPPQVGDIRIDWSSEGKGLIYEKPGGIRQAICTYVVKYDNFDNPEYFASLLVQWCEELPCTNLNVPSGHWSNTVWSENKWAFVAESIEYLSHPRIANAAQEIADLKKDLLAQADARAVKRVDCDDYCKDPSNSGNNADHAIWDGASDYPECACTCAKGWTMESQGCVSCEDSCQKEGDHYVYDPDLSYTNVCECKCEDGYESGWDDSGEKACKKVVCPENSVNTADLDGSSLPSDDRKLSRHCYCDEGYITSFGTCLKQEPGTEELFIDPGVKEITVGETIDFILQKKEYGRYTTVSDDEIEWSVSRHRSIDPNVIRIEIGTIDGSGKFTSKNIGTCQVTATSDGITIDAYVTVICSKTEEGDLDEVLRLYMNRIPKGKLWRDFDTLVHGYYDSGYARYYSHFLDNILDNPPAAGFYNNMMSMAGYQLYDEYACGSYQAKVLNFLSDIQSNPDECTLLNGYEFGPIEGRCGRHHAAVIYPEGSDWKTTGTILDPWPSQTPQYVSISNWGFRPVAGESQQAFREYPTYPINPETYTDAASELCNRMDDVQMEAMERTWDFVDTIVGIILCPVNVRITDSEGRQLGMLADGSMTYEIPLSYIWNAPLNKTENYWYFELNSTTEPYNFELTGIDDGKFELLWVSSEDKIIVSYGEQSITKGEIINVSIYPKNPWAPLILPDGSEIQPTHLGPVTEITSDPGMAEGLTFESRSKPKGSTVQIPLTLNGIAENIGSMDIVLSYDTSVLQAYEVIKGSLTSNSLFVSNIVDETIMIGLADNDGFAGDGSVAYVRYNVIGAEGSSSPLTIEEVLASTVVDFSDITIPANDGVFTVIGEEESTGDCDGDGKLAVVDALCALQMSVGNMAEDMIMDINSDGKVTAADAMRILKLALQ